MKPIVRCISILHNMCVDEIFESDEEPKEDLEDSTDIVGKEKSPMWGGRVRISHTVTSTAVVSLAALCEAQQFIKDEAEHAHTKELLIYHIWCKYGDQ